MRAWWRVPAAVWGWRARRLAPVLALLVLLPVGTAAAALRLEYAGDPSAAGFTRGHDAVWLGHDWVDGTKGPAAFAALRREVAGTGVRDLYVHTGPLSDDGGLKASLYPRAAWFVATVHRELPGVRVQAWLGDVVRHGSGPGLRLDDPAVRARITASARRVLALGYQGVHLDLEPVWSGDQGYLTLLDQVRRVTAARHALLSVAAPKIDPLPGLHRAAALTGPPRWWSQRYFGAVARRVDQVAVMAYDTGMPTPALFGGYVAQQTALALEVTPPDVDLIIGLPGYHTHDIGHHPSAERVAAAVRGARLGLARHAPHRKRFGMALYVDFAATARDWSEYRAGWGAYRS
jgi:hypothetical protein